jgi:protein-arginine kinase
MGIDKLIDMNKMNLFLVMMIIKLEELSDSIYRSFGIIQYARQIEYNEALHHLTNLRLGLELGLRLNVTVENIK